jgi:MFS family permease
MSEESIPPKETGLEPTTGEDSFIPGVKKNVLVLGLVSFFTDISSEMIYPLVPIFLTTVLGAPMGIVGIIEGIAESTASFLRGPSGWFSDRVGRRKPLVFVGYGTSSLGKLLLASAFAWPFVLLARFVDRLGKAVRTPARDALIAESSEAQYRGRAFGLHRALDTLGATIGPLFGLLFLWILSEDNMRWVFLIAFAPALFGVLLVNLAREKRNRPKPAAQGQPLFTLKGLSSTYRLFLVISVIFALGNSSDVFLILRAKDIGMSTTTVVLTYVFFNAIAAALSMPFGMLSDRIGRRTVMTVGFLAFGAVYLGMGFASSASHIWILFAVYGVYVALTEGISRAFVSDLAPPQIRATALGTYTMAIGLMALLASVLAGQLWDHVGAAAPFLLGGSTALLSALLMLLLIPRRTTVMA